MALNNKDDFLGSVVIEKGKFWGASTHRAINNFPIGREMFPHEFIDAYAIVKGMAAISNCHQKLLSSIKKDLILKALKEILAGNLYEHFPLKIWQSGSGTQINMNINEVMANYANEIAVKNKRENINIHPNDDVNMSQSTNDTFQVALHIAVSKLLSNNLLPSLSKLSKSLLKKEMEFMKIIKIGRTHLQDAVPISLGQEFSAYKSQIDNWISVVKEIQPKVCELAIGGTAVGTGLNADPKFSSIFIKKLNSFTGMKFKEARNKFSQIAAHDYMVQLSGILRGLSSTILKIANDIRLLASGPKCGLSELILTANECGSSIMPGKINPTQCEMISMVCIQVMGNDAAIGIAGSQGHLELNANKPLIMHNIIQSIYLLSDACNSFRRRTISSIKPNLKKIVFYLNRSEMIITALNPVIGYDKAALVVKKAQKDNISLKESCLKLGYMSEKEFKKLVNPHKMV